MKLFGRMTGDDLTTQLRDNELQTAEISRKNAAEARRTGKPVGGIDADGWDERVTTFQNAADDYQRKLDRRR